MRFQNNKKHRRYYIIEAFEAGNKEQINMWLNTEDIYLDEYLYQAAKHNYEDILDRVLAMEGIEPKDINFAAYVAVKNNNREIFNKLMSKYADVINPHLIALGAIKKDRKDILQAMLELGADEYEIYASHAAKYNRLDILQQMINKGAKNYIVMLVNAMDRENEEIIEYLLNTIRADEIRELTHGDMYLIDFDPFFEGEDYPEEVNYGKVALLAKQYGREDIYERMKTYGIHEYFEEEIY